MNKGVSRRNFLKGSAIAAVGAAGAATLASCSSGESAASATPEWMPESWDMETDVLVIGYGGAGLWAGITAYDNGAEVLFLEKAPIRGGGSSSINMGQWTAPKEVDGAAQFAYEASHGQTPMEYCRAWAEEAVKNPDYADEYGLDYTLSEKPRAEYDIFDGYEQMYVAQGAGYGPGFFDTMDQHVKDRGIEIVFSCHDEELIQNPITKEIVGCYTLVGDDSTKKAIKARKGVVLTMGGFEYNTDMQRDFLKCYPCYFFGWQYNTGDGIKMVQKVGADLWHMNSVSGCETSWFNDKDYPFGISVGMPADGYIKVNRLGQRYINEDIMNMHGGWKEYEHFDEDICDFDRIPSWYVFDDVTFHAGSCGNMVGGRSVEAGGMPFGHISENLPDELGHWQGWSVDNQWELERGWIKKGDTIEELAAEIRKVDPDYMDAETLTATINHWNEMVAAGEDTELGRTKMAPVSTPPYYAIIVQPGHLNTVGGARRNENANVVNPDGEPIPRLYSAGSFGGQHGHTYAITGGNGSENWCFGRIAGRNAAALDNWDADSK